jgi:hypothetical protein
MHDQQQQHDGQRRRRTLPLVVVAAIHLAALAILLNSSPPARRFVESAREAVMIFLPETRTRAETKPLVRPARKQASSARPQAKPEAPPMSMPTQESSAPVDLPPVDWQQAMLDAAKKKGDETPWQSVAPKANEKPKHEFGWSHARTHRVERDKETGVVTAINLNDRCALVAALMFLPVCQFGKIPARGDLFDDMRDPDRPSSVPDAPKSDMLNSGSRSSQ